MRITGGTYRGRLLKSPDGMHIRPTSDKVRQAIFNILNARGLVQDAIVVDAFCGTGALGLEAISHGASCCTFIDKDRRSLDLCRENFAAIKSAAKCSFVLNDAAFLGNNTAQAAHLVFLDPPYRKGLVKEALTSLSDGNWLSIDACVLVESETGLDPLSYANAEFEILMERDYGDTKITLLRRLASGLSDSPG